MEKVKRAEGPKLSPCAACPWRTENHLKRHRFGFYTKKNLTRLWNQIRGGGAPQSCHPTDTSHPDHVACGAKGDKPKECAGSVILVLREMKRMADFAEDKKSIGPEEIDQYKAVRKKGLNRGGMAYWLVSRLGLGGVPFVGGAPLPQVDIDDDRISLPVFLKG